MTGTEMAFKEMDDRVAMLRAEVEKLRTALGEIAACASVELERTETIKWGQGGEAGDTLLFIVDTAQTVLGIAF